MRKRQSEFQVPFRGFKGKKILESSHPESGGGVAE